MQTTLRIDDQLYRQAKAQAASLGISLTRLLEDALREHLHAPEPHESRSFRLPVSSVGGGLLPSFSSLEEAVAAADLERDRQGMS
jgi:hypothetical protein